MQSVVPSLDVQCVAFTAPVKAGCSENPAHKTMNRVSVFKIKQSALPVVDFLVVVFFNANALACVNIPKSGFEKRV